MFTLRSREDGQTMAEYAVILGVIAAVIVLAMGTLTTAISGRHHRGGRPDVIGHPQGPARFGRSPARRAGSESGQSLVEFVLVLGPLLLILFGILELGLVMFDKVTVVNDAREAARLASVNDASGKTLLGDAPAGSSLTFTCATDPNSGNAAGLLQRRRQDHRARHLRAQLRDAPDQHDPRRAPSTSRPTRP